MESLLLQLQLLHSEGEKRKAEGGRLQQKRLCTDCKRHQLDEKSLAVLEDLKKHATPDIYTLEEVFGVNRNDFETALFTRSEQEVGQGDKLGHWWTDAEMRKYIGEDFIKITAMAVDSVRLVKAVANHKATNKEIFCLDMYAAHKRLYKNAKIRAMYQSSQLGKEFLHFAEEYLGAFGVSKQFILDYPLLSDNVFCVKYQNQSEEDDTIGINVVFPNGFVQQAFVDEMYDPDEEKWKTEEFERMHNYFKNWMGLSFKEGTFVLNPNETLFVTEDKRKVTDRKYQLTLDKWLHLLHSEGVKRKRDDSKRRIVKELLN